MSDHPTRAELEALLRGELPDQRMPAVLRHLLAGCQRCRAVVYPRAAPLLAPQPPEVSERVDAAYDRAIDKAIATARRLTREKALQAREKALYEEALRVIDAKGPLSILHGPLRLRGLEGLRALLDRSWTQRRERPRDMVALARAATEVAGGLAPGRLDEKEIEDHRCRAWTELANAQRVAEDYERASESLTEAVRHLLRGTGSQDMEVRLLDVKASLEGHRCHFSEAFDTLNIVAGVHLQRGDTHMAGRALISKGAFKGYHGETDEALELIRSGREMLDERRDPVLYLQAIHNEVLCLVDSGLYREARTLLWSNLGRYGEHGGKIDHLKMKGLWALINAGLGNLGEAARDFEEERNGLQAAGLYYTAAVASLDLAAVYLQQGRVSESDAVALEAAEVFREMEIPEQGRLALLLLEKALEVRLATAELLRRTARFLRRIEHDTTAVFDPKP